VPEDGSVEFLRDADRDTAWTVLVDGVPQSSVDLDDPHYLAFEYVRRLGHVLDLLPPGPLDAVHLGGGALTLPRYVAATRPGSRQRVFEIDEALTDLVRARLPLHRSARVRVRTIDARAGVQALRDSAADVVIGDVYAGARVPAHLTSAEFVAELARILRPGATYAANFSDGPGLAFVRGQVATLRTAFPHVCLIAEPGVLRGRRFGNVVAVASRENLPIADLARRTASDPIAARVVDGEDLDRLVAGARIVTDATAVGSPRPPDGIFVR
jgi:spermidine synthase